MQVSVCILIWVMVPQVCFKSFIEGVFLLQALPIWGLAIPLPAVLIITLSLYLVVLGIGFWLRSCLKVHFQEELVNMSSCKPSQWCLLLCVCRRSAARHGATIAVQTCPLPPSSAVDW